MPGDTTTTAGIEVVGAGFGRTGTYTLRMALNHLGYKTHHMLEIAKDPSQVAGWYQAVRDRAAGRPTDWRAVLGAHGYNAAVDWPSAAFYKEILAANPDAKVVLTLRDFDAWYDSVMKTIYHATKLRRSVGTATLAPWLGQGNRDILKVLEEVIWSGTFGGRIEDREHARKVYEAHLEEVRHCVPREQLLEFDVRQGWQPLCAFLGKPVPQEPFPHVNDEAAFRNHANSIAALGRQVAGVRAVGNAVLVAALAAMGNLALRRVLCGGYRRRSSKARSGQLGKPELKW